MPAFITEKFDYNQPEADKDFEKGRIAVRQAGLGREKTLRVGFNWTLPSFSEEL